MSSLLLRLIIKLEDGLIYDSAGVQMEVLKGESDGYKTEITVVTVEAGGRKSSHDQKMRLLLVRDVVQWS